jgi:AraC family transcriptional regulator
MVLVNPGSAALWQSHVLLNGQARDYHVADFAGPLSIKAVLRGKAAWQTEEGRFEIRPGSCLLINNRQPYSITVESREQVETFCVFFKAGFVEDIQTTMTSPDRILLDQPVNNLRLEFDERLRTDDIVLTPLLRSLNRRREEQGVLRLAESLVALHKNTIDGASKLPAAKLSTRIELLRRVHRGRNAIEDSLSQPLSLDGVA